MTRNRVFPLLFLSLSLKYRERLVNQVRSRSQNNVRKSMDEMDVADAVIQHMQDHSVTHLIHGHTHKPGVHSYEIANEKLLRFVLSDWDDNPKLLCYDNTKGFYFAHM